MTRLVPEIHPIMGGILDLATLQSRSHISIHWPHTDEPNLIPVNSGNTYVPSDLAQEAEVYLWQYMGNGMWLRVEERGAAFMPFTVYEVPRSIRVRREVLDSYGITSTVTNKSYDLVQTKNDV